MEKQKNDEQKVEILKRRINLLEERIRLQKNGYEVDTAKKIRIKLQKKLEEFITENDVMPTIDVFTSNSNDIKKAEELGVLYYIFGEYFEMEVSYKKYEVRFIHLLKNIKFDYGCLLSVEVEIYENDKPLLINKSRLEFWKAWNESTKLDDIGIYSSDEKYKYGSFHWLQPIKLAIINEWNYYFDSTPLIEAVKFETLTLKGENNG